MSQSWSRLDRPLWGESRRSYKIIIPNSHDYSWPVGIRLESMDYCGSKSLAAIQREWLAGFELERLAGFDRNTQSIPAVVEELLISSINFYVLLR